MKLLTHSVEHGISVERVLVSMRDRASTNEVAIRTIKGLYPNLIVSHT